MGALGNVAFLERPFHPTTLLSVVRTALRGRNRQYEARSRLDALHESESHARHAEARLRSLNETLEARVQERTAELAAANRQLLSQIEEKEKVESTLRQMQRLEAIGQLTSGVAHDFNNLLTVVLGNIGFLERNNSIVGDPKLQQRLAHMRLATERGAKLTSQLLAFSRRQRLEPKPFGVNEALENMHNLLQSTLGGGVSINTVLRPGTWHALADPAQIELVVLNLVINARDAMEDRGNVTIETANAKVGPPERPEEPPAGDYVMIAVTDTGSGMTKEVLAKAFEPFFTTKEIGKGSGLGLSQVLGFAKQSGGGMRIETRVGEGTSVKVYLPRAEIFGSEATVVPVGAARSNRKGALILIVDDDSAVRDVTASILEDLGYVLLKVGSGGAALDLLDRQPNVDLVLLDFAMPGMSGVEVARQVQLNHPAIPILFVTGYADKNALRDVGEERIIKKPFIGEELAKKVNAALIKGIPRLGGKVVAPLRL
jgi:signal transduction histidine kinase